mmetsp:Transcript_57336/g.121662  ORF Transcript_57336/g.121662 Transcript_57336/m.121662 type:complete len:257 (+) Transcript_57336:761-1531(+)
MEYSVVETIPGAVSPRAQRHWNLDRFQFPHCADEPLTLRDSSGGNRREELLRAELRLEHVPSREVARRDYVAHRQLFALPSRRHGGHCLDVGLHHVRVAVLVIASHLRRAACDYVAARVLLPGPNARWHLVVPLHLIVLVVIVASVPSVDASDDAAPTPCGLELLLQAQGHKTLAQLLEVLLPEVHGVGGDGSPHEELRLIDLRHDLLAGQGLGGCLPLAVVRTGVEAVVRRGVVTVAIVGGGDRRAVVCRRKRHW